MLNQVLAYYGLDAANHLVEPFGPGLINHTYRVSGKEQVYILQEVNTNVFKSPHDIARNLVALKDYFAVNYPDYLFVAPISAINGEPLVEDSGRIYRLFPFVKGSHTLSVIDNEKQAFEAAKQFGQFTKLLKDFDTAKLAYTLPDFHHLELRFEQFTIAISNAHGERLNKAEDEIKEVYRHQQILEIYNNIVEHGKIPLRVIHHDTKISNVLFDDQQNGLCVIDLDTVMPGYYISDIGDMMRTYLSPANEEESDFDKIHIRKNIFNAICRGYLAEMKDVLTETEKQYFVFSGQMMIYMQAVRFLTDFLNNDIYYGATYPEHNLNRTKNQFKLLNEYTKAAADFELLVLKITETSSISI